MGKEIGDLMRYQHNTGGFYDGTREPNAKDTLHALWLASVYGAFNSIDTRSAFRWLSTLHNRDGGAGMQPGAKSSLSATYSYFYSMFLISPDQLSNPQILEFIKSHYDSGTGLFRDTLDSVPSVEASYYANKILMLFQGNEEIVNKLLVQNFLAANLDDDHFDFSKENVDNYFSQLYGIILAKSINYNFPQHRLAEYIISNLQADIKSGSLTLEQAAVATQALTYLQDDPIPAVLRQWVKRGHTLADLYSANQILVSIGEVSKFFETRVTAVTTSGQVIDIEKEGVTVGQIIRPTVSIVSLGRYVSPMLHVNVTMRISDELPITESLQIDYHTGNYQSEHATNIGKLGVLQIDVTAWFSNPLGTALIIQKSVSTHVSLSIDITCEAYLSADSPIALGDLVSPGTNFRSTLEGHFDEQFPLPENTQASFAVTDPAGTLLYYSVDEFKGTQDFTWQLPSTPLPSGNVKVSVEVGDPVNGIHTRRDFEYRTETEMAAIDIEIPTGLKLSEVLKVKMVPALAVSGDYVPFTNEKYVESELTDAAGEVFFPQAAVETHKYKMVIKVGGQSVKEVDGEVSEDAEKKQLVVEFETSIDENLDYATGFLVEFKFSSDNGGLSDMKMEKEAFVSVAATIAAEGGQELLKGGKLEYGSEIKGDFRLKDLLSGHNLAPGYAYPVICVLSKDTRKVLYERRVSFDDDKEFEANLVIGAAVPTGEAIVAVFIRKGLDLVPITLESGALFETPITINGKLDVDARVIESSQFIIVDFRTVSNGKTVPGTSFNCAVKNAQGELVATVPVAQMNEGARFSWVPTEKKGEYTLELLRQSDTKPFFVTKVTIESSFVGMAQRLPVEEIAIVVSIILVVYAIKYRKQMKFIK
jgi:hypothetical protein